MIAKLIRYIRFSLYNCLEITVSRVWKTWETQGISFCQICKRPARSNENRLAQVASQYIDVYYSDRDT